jgi:myo-inositol 2-dehydrogenase/D-chiro-inositol 1-dehydrogenase
VTDRVNTIVIPSPFTVDDAVAVAYIAEAATLSLQQHRPVQIAEVSQS